VGCGDRARAAASHDVTLCRVLHLPTAGRSVSAQKPGEGAEDGRKGSQTRLATLAGTGLDEEMESQCGWTGTHHTHMSMHYYLLYSLQRCAPPMDGPKAAIRYDGGRRRRRNRERANDRDAGLCSRTVSRGFGFRALPEFAQYVRRVPGSFQSKAEKGLGQEGKRRGQAEEISEPQIWLRWISPLRRG